MSTDFNGTTSRVTVGTSALLNNAQPFTVMAWASLDGAAEGAVRLFAKGSSNTFNSGEWGLFYQAGNVRFLKEGGGTDLSRASTFSALAVIQTDGRMYHIACSWTGANATGGVRLFVDGEEVTYGGALNTTCNTLVSDSGHKLIIGNCEDQTRTWNGRIAHAQFFRKVLTQDQIRQAMRHPGTVLAMGSPTAVGTAGLIGYWPMDAFGALVYDYSGCGHHGTPTTAVPNSQTPAVNEVFTINAPGGCYAAC